ncbi:MAG: DUF2523 family protein [Thiothrix sp.]|uniref:DUF2523 family protein n=1 Tax=Thiothrix sp. TaxID=1032 RepID=UPI00260CD988|nr:DUF2523 family protein [Thiothrix sp.]MDD5392818.1 DUF2523 family protein [Thiothrix sp.]
MEILLSSIASLVDWLDWFFNFGGLIAKFQQLLGHLMSGIIVGYWTLKLSTAVFMWGVAKQILLDLQVTQYIDSLFTNFDSQIISMLLWFRIPDFIHLIVTAYVTRWAIAAMSSIVGFASFMS